MADDAPPVIRKIHKRGTAADPLRGLFATTIDGKPAVVEYEPDPDLRDTEQVPLLEEGGIEASCAAKCCRTPRTPGTCRQRQDRLRDQLHPLLLQAAAAAHAGGDPRRHPGAGEGDRGAARRDHRREGVTTMSEAAKSRISLAAGKLGEDEEFALEHGLAIIGFQDVPSLEGATDYDAVFKIVEDEPAGQASRGRSGTLRVSCGRSPWR